MSQGKGGGAKTAAGKARSSKNAVKHGVFSPHPAIIEELETVEEWEEFRDEIVESWAPVGRYEQELAQTIASAMWRRRRIIRYETGVINYDYHGTWGHAWQANAYLARDKDNVEDPDPDLVVILQQQKVIPRGADLDNIVRYESHLIRLIFQNVHELEARQAARRGEKTSLARIDVTSAPRGVAATPPRPPEWIQHSMDVADKHTGKAS